MAGGGKGGKGGGGGAVDVDVTSTSTSVVDADSNSNITASSTNNLTSNSTNQIDSKATAQLQVVGLDNVRLKADTTADNRTQLEMDLKPLQVDLCLKVGLERLPSTRICRPSHRHFGLTVFGVEVIGFNYASEKRTIIEDMRGRPMVAGELPMAAHSHDAGGIRIHVGD
jgi:hypothetical protein